MKIYPTATPAQDYQLRKIQALQSKLDSGLNNDVVNKTVKKRQLDLNNA